jgi:hypothetical protein
MAGRPSRQTGIGGLKMATEIIKAAGLPTVTPQHAQSLSPQKLQEHRAAIAFDVEVILDGYWDSRPPDHIKAGILADWSDALQDWTGEQVLWALRKWRNDNPSKKPNPGHILAICKAKRGARVAAEMRQEETAPEPKTKVTKEQAEAILADAGFSVKRMNQ